MSAPRKDIGSQLLDLVRVLPAVSLDWFFGPIPSRSAPNHSGPNDFSKTTASSLDDDGDRLGVAASKDGIETGNERVGLSGVDGGEGEKSPEEVAAEFPSGKTFEIAPGNGGFSSAKFKDNTFKVALEVSVSVEFDRAVNKSLADKIHGNTFLRKEPQ